MRHVGNGALVAVTLATLVASTSVIALAGCTAGNGASGGSNGSHSAPPSDPQPLPTTPPLSKLVLSSDGLGPLKIGNPVPNGQRAIPVVVWESSRCEGTGAWIPNYSFTTGAQPFSLSVTGIGQPVSLLVVHSPQIATAAGVTVGQTVAQLKAAYPSVTEAPVTSPTQPVNLYTLAGAHSQLVFEVGSPAITPSTDAGTIVEEYLAAGTKPVGEVYGTKSATATCPDGSS